MGGYDTKEQIGAAWKHESSITKEENTIHQILTDWALNFKQNENVSAVALSIYPFSHFIFFLVVSKPVSIKIGPKKKVSENLVQELIFVSKI